MIENLNHHKNNNDVYCRVYQRVDKTQLNGICKSEKLLIVVKTYVSTG